MTDGKHHQILVPFLLLLFSWGGGTSIVEKCKREVKKSSQDRYMESDNMVNMFSETKIKIDFLAYLENI